MRRVGVAGVAALLTGLTGLTGCAASSAPAPRAPSSNVGTRLDGPVPAAVLGLPLVDETGATRHLSDFTGRIVVLSDSMTLCQETCPLDTASLVQTARAVDRAGSAKDVVFLTVTVDPGRDTPRRLAAYRRQFRPAPANWLTLTGTPAHVAALWRSFGVYMHRVGEPRGEPAPRDWLTGRPLTYDVQHSDEVFFLDARQEERFLLEGPPSVGSRSTIPTRLYRFMSAEGHRNVLRPGAGAWTSQQAVQVVAWLDRRTMTGS